MSSLLDRQAPCPSCGATLTFKFAGAKAIVCKYCKALVARTDRSLAMVGRVADLIEIASPLTLHASGRWNGKRFEVEGRVQLDRAGAPGAPWQEFFIGFPETGTWSWVASAQGRWYATQEVPNAPPLPAFSSLRPGMAVPIALPNCPPLTVVEVGKRRVVSAEGELPNVAVPGGVTPFVDVSGPNGMFGTFDYGDGQSLPPKLYLGSQFDPAGFALDSGQPLDVPQAKVTEAQCPNCGGSLPLIAPGTAERVVCKYCGTISDVRSGALSVLGQAPRPPQEPYIPLGAEGLLRGQQVTCIGFVIRGTTVEGERYRWREYLLYGGPSSGYAWLMEEDGKWQFVLPIAAGDVRSEGRAVFYRNNRYHWKQSVRADVEFVVGEFYWKVEIGESVQATEYQGAGGIVSVEEAPTEVSHSFCAPISGQELAQAFKLSPPASPAFTFSSGSSGGLASNFRYIWIIIVILIILLSLSGHCGSGGGSGSSGVYIGPSYGGK